VKIFKCSACGHTSSLEVARCPFCRQKSLVAAGSFKSSGVNYFELVRGREAAGSHPLVSLFLVSCVALALALILRSWMFPY